jgi:hypothetical protein
MPTTVHESIGVQLGMFEGTVFVFLEVIQLQWACVEPIVTDRSKKNNNGLDQ